MLVVSNISKRFPGADTSILQNVSFTVNAGERVGLIGPNGCGKSTLLHIIMGDVSADAGSIQRTPTDLRIGYLSQSLDAPDNTPIHDVLFPQDILLREAEHEIERLAEAMTSPEQFESLSAAYADALDRIERYSQIVEPSRGEQMLAALDLGHVSLDGPVGSLSGGQKTRLGLALLLLNEPQLLILDEPTNHLDLTALEWLESWLQNFEGGALIVSHDRTFLDETVSGIVALDPNTHTARVIEGDYSNYAATQRSELDKQWAVWRDQQIETARLKTDARRMMSWSARSSSPDVAKRMAQKAKAKEKRLERYQESNERVEKPAASWHLKLDFDELPTTRQDVITLEALTIGYDVPLLSNLNLSLGAGERIALLGANGHGKSTLIKTIIGEIRPLAGRVRIGASVKIGYLAQEQEILDAIETPLAALLAQSPTLSHTEARSFLHFFLFTGSDVFRPVANLSFGERARLMLALLVARGANLLVLDEPINHLDVASREQFEQALSVFRGSVIAVVHDRYFVDRFATTIWEIKEGTLQIR